MERKRIKVFRRREGFIRIGRDRRGLFGRGEESKVVRIHE
jgi:hypothetical protein